MNPFDAADIHQVLAVTQRHFARACATVAVASATVYSPVSPAQTWTPLGPEGGRITALLAEPGPAGRAYAIGRGGMFRSDDAGLNWLHVGRGVTGNPEDSFLILDPDQPGRLYFSDDHSRMLRSDDYAETWTATGFVGTPYSTASIADLPGSTNTLLAASYRPSISKSIDGGASFSSLGSAGLPSDGRIVSLAVNPVDPLDMLGGIGYLSSGPATSVLYRSRNGGQSWSMINLGASAREVRQLAYLGGGRIVAKLDAWSYLSLDDGATWTKLTYRNVAALPGIPGGLIGIGDTNCNRTYDNFATTASCAAGPPFEMPAQPYNQQLAAVSLPNGGYRVLLANSRFGVFALDSTSPSWVASNHGLHSTNMQGVAIHPNDAGRIHAGLVDRYSLQDSMVTSIGDGPIWQGSLYGMAETIRTFTIDPTTAAVPATTHIYAGGAGSRQPVDVTGGIYKSTNGGLSWVALDQGLPLTSNTLPGHRIGTIRDIVLDPHSCASPSASGACTNGPLNTVYAVADKWISPTRGAQRVFKSTQGGEAWIDASAGLPLDVRGQGFDELINLSSLVIDPINTSMLFVGSYGFYENDGAQPRPNPLIPTGVFRSTDGGNSWSQRSGGLPRVGTSVDTVFDVHALAMHPRKSGIVWASTVQPGQVSRVYRTLDGGANWLPSGDPLAHCDVRALLVDPSAPQIVYASGITVGASEGCVYRSEDGGANWISLHVGVGVTRVLSMARDPQDQRRIVVTSNSGVWELRSAPDLIFNDLD